MNLTERETYRRLDELVARTGWDETSLKQLMVTYIVGEGMAEGLLGAMREVAEVEEAEDETTKERDIPWVGSVSSGGEPHERPAGWRVAADTRRHIVREWMTMPWRVGSKQGRSVYVDDGINADPQLLIGTMDTDELAAHVVDAHNLLVKRYGQCGARHGQFVCDVYAGHAGAHAQRETSRDIVATWDDD